MLNATFNVIFKHVNFWKYVNLWKNVKIWFYLRNSKNMIWFPFSLYQSYAFIHISMYPLKYRHVLESLFELQFTFCLISGNCQTSCIYAIHVILGSRKLLSFDDLYCHSHANCRSTPCRIHWRFGLFEARPLPQIFP